MATFISHSPEETRALGMAWARAAQVGWVIGLSGDLGAGKTQLVKGFAEGLGISRRIQSPTFALVNEYEEGRLPLAHLDLYRLENLGEIHGAGLDEFLTAPRGVALVEWIERWLGPLTPDTPASIRVPSRFRMVWITEQSETVRRITYEDSGL